MDLELERLKLEDSVKRMDFFDEKPLYRVKNYFEKVLMGNEPMQKVNYIQIYEYIIFVNRLYHRVERHKALLGSAIYSHQSKTNDRKLFNFADSDIFVIKSYILHKDKYVNEYLFGQSHLDVINYEKYMGNMINACKKYDVVMTSVANTILIDSYYYSEVSKNLLTILQINFEEIREKIWSDHYNDDLKKALLEYVLSFFSDNEDGGNIDVFEKLVFQMHEFFHNKKINDLKDINTFFEVLILTEYIEAEIYRVRYNDIYIIQLQEIQDLCKEILTGENING